MMLVVLSKQETETAGHPMLFVSQQTKLSEYRPARRKPGLPAIKFKLYAKKLVAK
jgi:hypothetical protein